MEIVHVVLLAFLTIIGEARCEKALDQGVDGGDPDRSPVQCSPLAFPRREKLVSHGVIDHARDYLSLILERDGHGETGIPMSVIGGAVKGVDDPTIAGLIPNARLL